MIAEEKDSLKAKNQQPIHEKIKYWLGVSNNRIHLLKLRKQFVNIDKRLLSSINFLSHTINKA